jgi:hypothetical protein
MEWYDWFSAGWTSGMLMAISLTYLVGWFNRRNVRKIRTFADWRDEVISVEGHVRLLDSIDIPLGPHARA